MGLIGSKWVRVMNSSPRQLSHTAAQKVFGIYQCCLELGCYGTHSAERWRKNLVPGQDLPYLTAAGGSEQRFLPSIGTLELSNGFWHVPN